MWIDSSIGQKKRFLAGSLKKPMKSILRQCRETWHRPQQLSQVLQESINALPCCNQLYCLDTQGRQVSGRVSNLEVDMQSLHCSLQHRPYFQGLLPYNGLALSSIYLSLIQQAPCITALHAVRNQHELLGFLAADFFIEQLPQLNRSQHDIHNHWLQLKGDPSIRSTVFLQQRTHSLFDQRIDRVIHLVSVLFKHFGVFHVQLDFSSARLVAWRIDAPYEFQVFSAHEVISGQILKNYTRQSYPVDALVAQQRIDRILARFKQLRLADDTLYLRTVTFNIINDTVGLTFSCDGYHLMPTREFLNRDLTFWFGKTAETGKQPTPWKRESA